MKLKPSPATGKLERALLLVLGLCVVAPLGTLAIIAMRGEVLAPYPDLQISMAPLILLAICLVGLLTVLRNETARSALDAIVAEVLSHGGEALGDDATAVLVARRGSST